MATEEQLYVVRFLWSKGLDAKATHKEMFSVYEAQMYHCQPQSKRASVQWKHPSSPSTKKFNVTPSAGKVILAVFWILRAVSPFSEAWRKLNSASYCEVLLTLRDSNRRRRPG
jgi:hypothetical protein